MAIRVLVVDDHFVVRAGVASYIDNQTDMDLVGDAGSYADALSCVDQLEPDIVLMDIRLGDGSGIDATRKIRESHPKTKVVMFTTYADLDLLRQSIEAGASGYVVKRMALKSLVDTIRRVVAGEELVIDERAEAALETGGAEAQLTERLRRLSPQERRVLSLDLRRPHQQADCRRAQSGGEDGEELRFGIAAQARHDPEGGGRRIPSRHQRHRRRRVTPYPAGVSLVITPLFVST